MPELVVPDATERDDLGAFVARAVRLDGAQAAKPAINGARICGLPHEGIDEATGLGLELYSRDEDGYATRHCEQCLYWRADWYAWLGRAA